MTGFAAAHAGSLPLRGLPNFRDRREPNPTGVHRGMMLIYRGMPAAFAPVLPELFARLLDLELVETFSAFVGVPLSAEALQVALDVRLLVPYPHIATPQSA
jgi:hypothetical protein